MPIPDQLKITAPVNSQQAARIDENFDKISSEAQASEDVAALAKELLSSATIVIQQGPSGMTEDGSAQFPFIVDGIGDAANLNNLTTSGWYDIRRAENTPRPAPAGALLVIDVSPDNSRLVHFFYTVSNDNDPAAYYRAKNGPTWGPWALASGAASWATDGIDALIPLSKLGNARGDIRADDLEDWTKPADETVKVVSVSSRTLATFDQAATFKRDPSTPNSTTRFFGSSEAKTFSPTGVSLIDELENPAIIVHTIDGDAVPVVFSLAPTSLTTSTIQAFWPTGFGENLFKGVTVEINDVSAVFTTDDPIKATGLVNSEECFITTVVTTALVPNQVDIEFQLTPPDTDPRLTFSTPRLASLTDLAVENVDDAVSTAELEALETRVDGLQVGGTLVINTDDTTVTGDATSTSPLKLVDAYKTKIDGVEDSATADQTGVEIIAAIDDELGAAWKTNTFTTAHLSKLNGIEPSATADQTGVEIVAAIDAQLGTNWKFGGQGTLTAVAHDATLSGAGTTASPLSVAAIGASKVTSEVLNAARLGGGDASVVGNILTIGSGGDREWRRPFKLTRGQTLPSSPLAGDYHIIPDDGSITMGDEFTIGVPSDIADDLNKPLVFYIGRDENNHFFSCIVNDHINDNNNAVFKVDIDGSNPTLVWREKTGDNLTTVRHGGVIGSYIYLYGNDDKITKIDKSTPSDYVIYAQGFDGSGLASSIFAIGDDVWRWSGKIVFGDSTYTQSDSLNAQSAVTIGSNSLSSSELYTTYDDEAIYVITGNRSASNKSAISKFMVSGLDIVPTNPKQVFPNGIYSYELDSSDHEVIGFTPGYMSYRKSALGTEGFFMKSLEFGEKIQRYNGTDWVKSTLPAT